MTNRVAIDGDQNHLPGVRRERAEGAFLGAAIGDALGWPHELRASRAGKDAMSGALQFEKWTKRSGGRFQPHEELIGAGEYSDDTQLILASARALLRSPASWWLSFATQELPLWTLYQRGGGGATKRAASIWLSGRAPWDAKHGEVDKYFSAGGNGVAMRVLPHCLRRADCPDFSFLAEDIMADGVTTHGHPRALVGALAYGYGLWQAFRHREMLEYGQLLEVVLSNKEAWGPVPAISERWPAWAAVATRRGPYLESWSATVDEQLDLLERCSTALAGGAAVIDEETLKDVGCFDRQVNGSGTVNAAAALFLASRHAVDPIESVKQAAFARGADTDTLASMTGGLLGAAVGSEWTLPFVRSLQDSDAIRRAANAVRDIPKGSQPLKGGKHITKASLSAFVAKLQKVQEPSSVEMPNGMAARAEVWDGVVSKSSSLSASSWRVTLEDGQTLFVKKLAKIAAQEPPPSGVDREPDLYAATEVPAPLHLGFRLVVSDLARSAAFYREVVGLPISKRTAKSVNLGGVLSIGQGTHLSATSEHITVFVEVSDVQRSLAAYRRLVPEGTSRIDERDDRIRLQCLDPDGYKIEIYELKRDSDVAVPSAE